MTGREPTPMITATEIIDSFMLLGGSASGPARKESIITEKIIMDAVNKDHNKEEDTDSGTGYETTLKKNVLVWIV
jgi:hypothetical protein